MLISRKINGVHNNYLCTSCHLEVKDIMLISRCPNCFSAIQPKSFDIIKDGVVLKSVIHTDCKYKCSGIVSKNCAKSCGGSFELKYCNVVKEFVKNILI